jgi:hypothetical protein
MVFRILKLDCSGIKHTGEDLCSVIVFEQFRKTSVPAGQGNVKKQKEKKITDK